MFLDENYNIFEEYLTINAEKYANFLVKLTKKLDDELRMRGVLKK